MKFNIINIPKLDSTNSYAQRSIENGTLHEGDVVFTLNQEKGKGQGDNFWESEPGSNLSASIVLEPRTIPASRQFVLTQFISLAIVGAIKKHLPGHVAQGVKIKWPNDIYVENNKIAGILFQNFIKGTEIEHSIVGIGINVNQKEFCYGAPNPVSIIHHTGKPININVLLDGLLEKIGINYGMFRAEKNFPELKSKYLNNLFRYNEWATYSDGKNIFQGKIVDVDEYGRLKVMLGNGAEKLFMFKGIEFVGL